MSRINEKPGNYLEDKWKIPKVTITKTAVI